jgi:serpin B
MAMACLGASGETREELTRVLGTDRFPGGELQARYADLLQTLRFSAQEQELQIANSVWVNDSHRLLPEYERSVRDCLEAEATSVPFSDAQSVKRINHWVNDKTNGKIGWILNSLSEEQRLILINCVYFKGLWDEPFEKARTKDKKFHAVDGDRQRPFMHMRSGFAYLEDSDCQAVCLKYGGFSALEMWIFLPSQKVGLQNFLDSLKPSFSASVQNKSQERPGTLALPRFKMECSNKLISGLRAAGIKRAFDPVRAEFDGAVAESEPLYISDVNQKAYLEVSEEGTEAAATTYIETMPTMAFMPEKPPKPFEMIVDRPFFVAVGDRSSGLLLFTASVWEV